MSKLDEMIRELCPDGVEYVRLGTLCSLITKQTGFDYTKHIKARLLMEPTKNAVPYIQTKFFSGKNFNYQTDYYVPMDIVEQFPKITLDEKCILFSIVGASIGNVGLFPGERKCFLGGAICVAKVLPQYDVDYVYYCVESHNVQHQIRRKTKGAGQATITVEDIREFEIPLPPIEVQREIVHTLDNYTENVVKLQNQLTAELTARKTQYAYYRDKLLQYKMPTKEYEVGEICEVSAGGDVPKEHFSKEKSEQYKVPVISNGCGINAFYGYTDAARVDKPAVTVAARGTIGYAEYRDYPYFPIIRLITLIPRDDKQLNAKYLYYSLEGRHYKVPTSGIPQLTVPVIKKEKVSIPPLDVQNRIVNVLDNFEKICSDLNIGLPAEIEARQKQYEYYRDKLLTFAENGNTILSRAEQSRAEQSRAEQSRALIKLLQYVFGYAVVSLQDVVKNSCSGGTPKKGVSEYYEDGNIPWLRTQEVVFRDICKTECFITESAVKNSAAKWIPENCVIVAISGATAGRCAINKIPLTTNQHCLNLEVDPEMALYRYVYYCICARQEELLAKKEGARGDLNSTRILSLQIDLPSIEKQKRIVSILDRFDAICNDLTSGLPAEIEARQKQYEYYRDKLLTFKEVAAT